MDSLYREAAEILEKASSGGGSLRSLIYATSKPDNYKKLLKLCSETSRHRPFLEKLLHSSPRLSNTLIRTESDNKSLCLILLYEYAISKQLKKKSGKLARYVFLVSDLIDEQLKSMGHEIGNKDDDDIAPKLPRYARVNTLKISQAGAIEKLKATGWRIFRLSSDASSKKQRELLTSLTYPKVYVDPHIPEVFIFPPDADLYSSELVNKGELILQDKVSYRYRSNDIQILGELSSRFRVESGEW